MKPGVHFIKPPLYFRFWLKPKYFLLNLLSKKHRAQQAECHAMIKKMEQQAISMAGLGKK